MNDFGHALKELCMRLEDFRWVARDIISPDSERRRRLLEYAERLKVAVDNFIAANRKE